MKTRAAERHQRTMERVAKMQAEREMRDLDECRLLLRPAKPALAIPFPNPSTSLPSPLARLSLPLFSLILSPGLRRLWSVRPAQTNDPPCAYANGGIDSIGRYTNVRPPMAKPLRGLGDRHFRGHP